MISVCQSVSASAFSGRSGRHFVSAKNELHPWFFYGSHTLKADGDDKKVDGHD